MKEDLKKDTIVHISQFETSSATYQSSNYLIKKESKKISNDQELIQSDPISCPQNQKGNN